MPSYGKRVDCCTKTIELFVQTRVLCFWDLYELRGLMVALSLHLAAKPRDSVSLWTSSHDAYSAARFARVLDRGRWLDASVSVSMGWEAEVEIKVEGKRGEIDQDLGRSRNPKRNPIKERCQITRAVARQSIALCRANSKRS